jgi:hypothetical protein
MHRRTDQVVVRNRYARAQYLFFEPSVGASTVPHASHPKAPPEHLHIHISLAYPKHCTKRRLDPIPAIMRLGGTPLPPPSHAALAVRSLGL